MAITGDLLTIITRRNGIRISRDYKRKLSYRINNINLNKILLIT